MAAPLDRANGARAPFGTEPGWRVLVVEDHRLNLILVQEVLSLFRCTALTALNGADAVLAVQTGPIDLVLMDVQLPVLDGAEATRVIRQWEAAQGCARIPVVGLTAHALPAEIQRCREAGMDEVLTKPFTLDALRDALSRFLPARSASA